MNGSPALRRLERVIASGRWFAAFFVVVHLLVDPPPAGRAALGYGIAVAIALFAVAGTVLSRRLPRPALRVAGLGMLVADVVLVSAFVALYREVPLSTAWGLFLLLPGEGALRAQLWGAMSVTLLALVGFGVPRALAAGGVDWAELVPPAVLLIGLALTGGIIGRDLERQLRGLARLNAAARRLAAQHDPGEVLHVLCEESVQTLGARAAMVVEVVEGARHTVTVWPHAAAAEILALPPDRRLVMPLRVGDDRSPHELVVVWGAAPPAMLVQVMAALVESAAIAIGTARILDVEQRTSQRLRYLEALRRRFVATIAHDLRLPLTVFKGVARVLRSSRGEIPAEEVDDLLASVERQANRLNRLADDLLDAARMDAGALQVRGEDVALGPLLEGTVADFSEPVDLDVEPGLTLHGDAARIDRMVWNLLSNAQRHGRAPFEVRAAKDDDVVVLSVRDHGEGMEAAQQERLFEEFAASADSEGAGLGLAIVRQLARAHGGSVDYADAQPGAVFTVRLPLRAPEDPAPAPVADPPQG